MAQLHFDERRQLVVGEANAIGTTMLRAELLPEPERGKTLEWLRQYAVVRRDTATVGPEKSLPPTKVLQSQIWEQMVSVTSRNQTAVMATYINALNEMMDVSENRLAAFEHRVPKLVWIIIHSRRSLAKFCRRIQLEAKILVTAGADLVGHGGCDSVNCRS